jgi:hypothetical protein
MPYKVTRDEIFRAAKMCAIRGVPTQATGKLTTEADINQAFSEWKAAGGSGVLMRLTTTKDGAVAAEFTPDAS